MIALGLRLWSCSIGLLFDFLTLDEGFTTFFFILHGKGLELGFMGVMKK